MSTPDFYANKALLLIFDGDEKSLIQLELERMSKAAGIPFMVRDNSVFNVSRMFGDPFDSYGHAILDITYSDLSPEKLGELIGDRTSSITLIAQASTKEKIPVPVPAKIPVRFFTTKTDLENIFASIVNNFFSQEMPDLVVPGIQNALDVTLEIPGDMSDEEVLSLVSELSQAIDDEHRNNGGGGLKLADSELITITEKVPEPHV